MRIDWPEYCRVHASRANLLLHLFAVPLFVAAFISLIRYVSRGDWVSASIVIVFAVVAMALQGNGHRKEPNAPRPFSGPANFLKRWFTEQFIVFPLFFVTGRWWAQWRAVAERNES